MNKKRTSVVWQVSSEEFRKIVKNSKTIADILRYFNLVTCSGNYNTIKQRIKEEVVDISHIPLGLSSNRGRSFSTPTNKRVLEEVTIRNSTYSRGNLKKRLLKDGIIENKCQKCGLKEEWQGKPIVMVLDHINGINNDHRLENLRMLCPNCNSQTPTFSGRKLKKRTCSNCNKELKTSKGVSGYCKSCICNSEEGRTYMTSLKAHKVPLSNKPTKEELKEMIKTMTWTAIGKKYGVSDNAIRKWAKRNSIV